MGHKVTDKILFVLVVGISIGFTWFVSGGASGTMIYNFIFLGIMILIYLFGMISGFGKMNRFEHAFQKATDEIEHTFETLDVAAGEEEGTLPEDLFGMPQLDHRYKEFRTFVKKSQSGLADIEDYINEDIVDSLVSKKMLDIIPDILTSLGILGTFIGLVVGLKDFEPSDYEAMTSSVSSLVDGIKVAFLTSIYGLSLSLVFSYALKSAYASLTDSISEFMDYFHNLVIPSAEAETRNIMVNCQEEQTKAIQKMTDQFSEHLANSFEKVITPSFRKMNRSMDILTETMAKGQEEMMKGLLNDFLSNMRENFQLQFDNFNQALESMTQAQKEMTEATKGLYQATETDLHNSFSEERNQMQSLVREMGAMQKEYLTSAQQTIDNNQKYGEVLDHNYRQIMTCLQDAEQSSAKFWIACNQAMQKYVSAASVSVEGFAAANRHNSNLYEANEKVIQSYNERMQEFVQYQKLTAQTMEQVQNLLYNIVTSPDETHRTNIRNMAINNSNRDMLMQIQKTLEEQGRRQEELLETMVQYMKESTRSGKKGKGIFFG